MWGSGLSAKTKNMVSVSVSCSLVVSQGLLTDSVMLCSRRKHARSILIQSFWLSENSPHPGLHVEKIMIASG